MTLFICMYVHCIGYRQRSVSVVMAPEPHSKSGFNLFCSVYISKREKILLEIYSKVHEWIFFLRSHDFCLSNSPEWSNSFPMKKNIKTFAPWYSQEKYFCQMWLHGTSGIYGFCLTKWSMTSQRLENLQLWADSDDRRARHTLFPSQISYKACAYYLVWYLESISNSITWKTACYRNWRNEMMLSRIAAE